MNKFGPSTIPDENKIEELLTKIQPAPSEQFHKKMMQASWRIGRDGSKRTINNNIRVRPALAIMALVVMIAALITTPQGRAFAQEIVQFFNRAESKVLTLPSDQIVSPEDTQSMATAQPPAQLVSVAEAEKTAGFDAKELPSTPKGFEFSGVTASDDGISIQYQAQENGGQLIINESTSGFMQSDWDQAPEEAITQVKIGALNAEIVQGAYVVYPDDTSARWNPDAPILRLRWIENGIWFEMARFGGVESIAYLDGTGLIALSESMK